MAKRRKTGGRRAGTPNKIGAEVRAAMLDAFVRARHDDYGEPELAAARPLIELQRKWSALPTPTLVGDTATYPNVPVTDVDLQVKVGTDGVSMVFVVKTPEAAADPQVRQLRFGLKTTGLTSKSDGGVQFWVNRSGRPILSTGEAVAWDSAGQRLVLAGPAGGVTVHDLAPDPRPVSELLRLVENSDVFQVLAHCDYPRRSWPTARVGAYREADYEEEYRTVFRALAGSGRALELNTSSPLASATLIRWWYEEGGDAVSFGSDAHVPLRVGALFEAETCSSSGHRVLVSCVRSSIRPSCTATTQESNA